jgi:hypothetical protein
MSQIMAIQLYRKQEIAPRHYDIAGCGGGSVQLAISSNGSVHLEQSWEQEEKHLVEVLLRKKRTLSSSE